MKSMSSYDNAQDATSDLPFGAFSNESSAGSDDGTNIVAEHLQDLYYALYQVLQLAGQTPNGYLENGNAQKQFLSALSTITPVLYNQYTTYGLGWLCYSISSGTVKIYRSKTSPNLGNSLSNSTYWECILTFMAGGMIKEITDSEIGKIVPFVASSTYTPPRHLACDGTQYTKANYTYLYENYLTTGKLATCSYSDYNSMISTYGSCPLFGLDTTNQKFKVPTIKDGAVIQQAKSANKIGKAYNAGLPNITGSFSGSSQAADGTTTGAHGAFYRIDRKVAVSNSGENDNYYGFDASRSSSIYGNSTTVQMNAVGLRYFVVVK